VKWLFLDVIPADTNGDKSLTDADKDADKKVLATADVDGSHYIGVWLGSIDTVFGKTCIDGEELLAVYSAQSKNLVSEIDILSRKITTPPDLPRLGP